VNVSTSHITEFHHAARPESKQVRRLATPTLPTLAPQLTPDQFSTTQTPIRFGKTSPPQSNAFKKVGSQLWHGFQQAAWKSFRLLEEAINDLTQLGCRMALLSTFIMPMPQFIYDFIERQTFYSPIKSCSDELIKDTELRDKLDDVLINIHDEKNKKRKLYAWHIPAQNNKPTIIFSHGRNTNISHYEKFLKAFTDEGFGVLAYDYPGFGNSQGKISKENCYRAGVGAVRHAKNKLNIPVQNQIWMGYSLGTHITAHMANELSEERPKGVVLLNSFPTLKEAFTYKIGTQTIRPLSQKSSQKFLRKIFDPDKMKDDKNLDTRSKLQSALDKNRNLDLMVFHSAQDQEVSPAQAQHMTEQELKGANIHFEKLGTAEEPAYHSLNKQQCQALAKKLAARFLKAV
jgi:alpha-beta hydrolase superfamily lysophospholipase